MDTNPAEDEPTSLKTALARIEEIYSDLRRTSTVLASFPWESDLAVHGQSLKTYFRDDDFLLGLALRIDGFEAAMRCSGDKHVMELAALIAAEDPTKITVSKPTYIRACSLLVSLRILDAAVKRNGEAGAIVLKHAKTTLKLEPASGKSDAVWTPNKYWDRFENWPQLLIASRDQLKKLQAIQGMTTPTPDNIPINNMRTILLHSMQLKDVDRAMNIVRNFHFAAASIAILVGSTSDAEKATLPELPEKGQEFFQYLINHCVDEYGDAEMRSDGDELMSARTHWPDSSKDKSCNMRSPLFLAALVSPIYLLLNVQLVATGSDKLNLMLFSKALGNEKPAALVEVENLLWEGLLSVAQGKEGPASALHRIMSSVNWEQITALACTADAKWFYESTGEGAITTLTDFQAVSDIPNAWSLAPKFCAPPPDRGHDASNDRGDNGDQSPRRGESEGGTPEAEAAGDIVSETPPTGKSRHLPRNASKNRTEETEKSQDALPKPKPAKKRKKDAKNKSTSTGKGKDMIKEQPKLKARFTTAPPSTKKYNDISVPKEAWHSQSLEAKYIPIDIDDVASGRPEISLKLEFVEKHELLEPIIYYTAKGDAVEARPRMHSEDDLATVHAIAKAAEKLYVKADDGTRMVPRFMRENGGSRFFITSHREFMKMKPERKLELIANKVIIVTDSPVSVKAFDEAGLSHLKNLDEVVDIQDNSQEPVDGDYEHTMGKKGTLDQMLQSASDPNGKILNALNFPMGMDGARPTPFSSETRAWRATEGLPYCKSESFPADDLRWAIAATAGAYHPWHLDAHGTGTWLTVNCGKKAIAVSGGTPGNPTVRNEFSLYMDKIDPRQAGGSIWDVECICLTAGDKIIFGPNTPHTVFTLEPAICLGGHFLASNTMEDALAANVHGFVAEKLITNTEHAVAHRQLIHRMIVFFHEALVLGKKFKDPHTTPHVPKITDLPSVINLLSACALAILMNALSKETYQAPLKIDAKNTIKVQRAMMNAYDLNALTALERERCIHGRKLAWEIIRWLRNSHTFRDSEDGIKCDLWWDIWIPFMGNLCLTIIEYQTKWSEKQTIKQRVEQRNEGVFLSAKDVEAQIHACLPSDITEYMEEEKDDFEKDIIKRFDFDCHITSEAHVIEKDDSSVRMERDIRKSFASVSSGMTALDEVYTAGRAANWPLYIKYVDENATDSETDSDAIPLGSDVEDTDEELGEKISGKEDILESEENSSESSSDMEYKPPQKKRKLE